ncbi:MAG TPA: hypothetical protein VK590_03215 [Saprospiraceae bacterium]|nr:hypothetical protein [Saprospiraceae bacterium]
MENKNYTTSILVDQSPEQAFNAINNVKTWWSSNFEGHSEKLNDVYTVHFGKTNITIQIIESIPFEKILWEVIDCHKDWLKNKKEWKGTKMLWEISTVMEGTKITFTHIGLVPGLECYKGCENAWREYIRGSLYNLITE